MGGISISINLTTQNWFEIFEKLLGKYTKHVHIFNSQKFHCCSPNCLRLVSRQSVPLYVKLRVMVCWGNIWQTQSHPKYRDRPYGAKGLLPFPLLFSCQTHDTESQQDFINPFAAWTKLRSQNSYSLNSSGKQKRKNKNKNIGTYINIHLHNTHLKMQWMHWKPSWQCYSFPE